MKNAYSLFGKPQEKRQIGRSRCRYEKIFKIYVKVIGCEEWTGVMYLGIMSSEIC
jgi:hypothetical protein